MSVKEVRLLKCVHEHVFSLLKISGSFFKNSVTVKVEEKKKKKKTDILFYEPKLSYYHYRSQATVLTPDPQKSIYHPQNKFP